MFLRCLTTNDRQPFCDTFLVPGVGAVVVAAGEIALLPLIEIRNALSKTDTFLELRSARV